jgi:hypothetical protein
MSPWRGETPVSCPSAHADTHDQLKASSIDIGRYKEASTPYRPRG